MLRGMLAMSALALVAACQDKPTDPAPGGSSGPAGKLVITAGLSPDPSAVDLSSVGSWNATPFRVHLSHPSLFDQLKIVANPGSERLIELGLVRPTSNTRSYCPAEGNDTVRRQPGQNVYIQVCGSGEASIVIQTLDDVAIDTLSFEVGQTVLEEPLTGRLVPDPSTLDWTQRALWRRFVVRLEGGKGTESVRIRVNPAGEDRLLSMSTWRRSSCYTGTNSTVTRRNNNALYLAACDYGKSSIILEHYTNERFTDESGNKQWGWYTLAAYEIERTAPPPPPADNTFDIELVFMDNGVFDAREKQWIRDAAEKWESIITEGIPDILSYVDDPYTFTAFWGGTYTVNERIDDIRIYVGAWDRPDVTTVGWGGARQVRWDSHLPIVAAFAFNSAQMDEIEQLNGFYAVALHEMAHCLGFSDWYWESEQLDLIRSPSANNPGADSHFIGPKAIAAFNQVGGWNYQGAKVPLENHIDISSESRDSHWRSSVFQTEIMDTYAGIGQYLSKVTIAAFEDMGYEVDYSQADNYRLPRQASKPAAHDHPESWCEVLHPVDAITPSGELIELEGAD